MKLKWNGFQVERLAVIDLCRGWWGRSVGTLGLSIGFIALATITISPFVVLPTTVIALALVGIAAALGGTATWFYISYLINQPAFLINQTALKANLLNGLDFDVLAVVNRWRARPTWRGVFNALMENPEAAQVLYRIGFNQFVLSRLDDSTIIEEDEIIRWLEAVNAWPGSGVVHTVYDFLAVLFVSGWDEVLNDLGVKRSDIATTIVFYRSQAARRFEYRRFWLRPVGATGVAADWTTGYTNLLDQSARRLSSDQAWLVLQQPLFGRSELISQALVELSKVDGANLLLIGEDGVGRRSLLLHLAALIVRGQSQTTLDGFQVRLLSIGTMLAMDDQLGAFLNQLTAEINRAGNFILIIEDLDLILDPRDPNEHQVAQILGQYLANKQIRLLASTTTSAYGQLIKPNPSLNNHFVPLDIPEPSPEALTDIILYNLPVTENRYGVFFPVSSITTLIRLAKRYLRHHRSPRRELELLEEVAVFAQAKDQPVISVATVTEVVERLAKVPIVSDAKEKQAVLELEGQLAKVVIGQSAALKAISSALARSGAGLGSETKPIGTFLFLGPTGVGKTETAKQLAKLYFGGTDKLIRIDLVEYADDGGLLKLLGRDAVADPGALTLALEQNPSAVVLLDELEKASLPVRNVLLPLLDEGRLTTNFGRVLDLTNTVVIATSNAGSAFVKERVEGGRAINETELTNQLIKDGLFSPELLNRFDAVVVFQPLTAAVLNQIVVLRLDNLTKNLWQTKQLHLTVEPAVVTELARLGYDPVFGARALDRVIKENLETAIARVILNDQPKPGQTINIAQL